jgi:hypothetical protein
MTLSILIILKNPAILSQKNRTIKSNHEGREGHEEDLYQSLPFLPLHPSRPSRLKNRTIKSTTPRGEAGWLDKTQRSQKTIRIPPGPCAFVVKKTKPECP